MSIGVSALSKTFDKTFQDLVVKRSNAEYLPSIWDDHFLSDAPSKAIDSSLQQEYERLKGEIAPMLKDFSCESSQKLSLIDQIKRLGVAYHFEKEIEDALLNQISHDNFNDDDLYTAALRFRLLRQQGIKVPSDVFERFKDTDGNFKESLKQDVAGMLSLFEATHLSTRGENILDEALNFTTTELKEALTHLSPYMAGQVAHALKWPIHRGVPRLEARYHIDLYSEDGLRNETILKFAKLDFNIVQQLHQKELRAVTRWWSSLDIKTKLPFARDRIVECYFWMLSVYFEPKYALGRIIITKIIAMLSLLDDTYDSYGTIEELKLLTEAVHRWDIEAIDLLPEYMKLIYRTLLDTYSAIEEEVAKQGTSYCIHYGKQAMKDGVQSYFDEAKWGEEGYLPNMKEYMQVSIISAGLRMLSTASLMGMGPIATVEIYEWILSTPKIIMASSTIGRLNDDIVSHKFEQERKHIGSAVECYMKEYQVSEEEAVEVLLQEVTNAWKDMNEEFFKLREVPMPIMERLFNLARAMDTVYKDGDGYTDNHLVKDHIVSLFLNPVPI